jgi:hypothetical protein
MICGFGLSVTLHDFPLDTLFLSHLRIVCYLCFFSVIRKRHEGCQSHQEALANVNGVFPQAALDKCAGISMLEAAALSFLMANFDKFLTKWFLAGCPGVVRSLVSSNVWFVYYGSLFVCYSFA